MLKSIISKIEKYKNTGNHSNGDYIFFDDLIEELTAISQPLEAEVKPANGGCKYCSRPVSKHSISGKVCDKCLDEMFKNELKFMNQD